MRLRILWALCVALATSTVPARAAVVVGDVAPEVTLPDASAKPVGLTERRGRVVVVDFTASWCVACRTALPALAALGMRYAGRGVDVVTVVVDGSRAKAERFLGEVVPNHGMTVLFDPTADTLKRFGAAGMPALYVIDREGVVRAVETGYDADRVTALAKTLDRVLAEPAPPRDETVAEARSPRAE
jgi:cytochrome c biogenesis protein CcmG/thiol:disulfide interchange protein DsbE